MKSEFDNKTKIKTRCFQPTVFLLVCRVRPILETARGVYSSKKNKQISTWNQPDGEMWCMWLYTTAIFSAAVNIWSLFVLMYG